MANDRRADDKPERSLESDAVPVRNLSEADLEAVVRIDAKAMGRRRVEYYRDKVAAALRDSRIHVSLAAELDGMVVGFLMGDLHYGEFGRAEPSAIIDSVGVHPDYAKRGVARALLRQFVANVRALGGEHVRTEVAWNDHGLMGFFDRCGFVPGRRLVLELDIRDR